MTTRIGLLACILALSGCSFWGYNKGLEPETHRGTIDFNDRGISAWIETNPPGELLSFGPLIFPVIPWPPGIFKVLFRRSKFQLPDTNLAVAMHLRKSKNPDGEFVSTTYAGEIKIIDSHGAAHAAQSIACDCDAAQKCGRIEDGRFSIQLSSDGFHQRCSFAFGIATSKAVGAHIQLENMTATPGNRSTAIAKTPKIAVSLKRRPQFYVFVGVE